MADPREDPRRLSDPDGLDDDDGQSSRPAAWPGIPGPEEEHLGSLATHAQTKDPPARVTRAQKGLEQDEAKDLEEWTDEQREEDELK